MAPQIEMFQVGEIYSNEEIYKSLNLSNAGGVRIRLDGKLNVRRMAVMTSSVPSPQIQENPYHDRIEGNILVYTGAGKSGDQELSGINCRLPQQYDSRFPIYLFTLIASRRDKVIGPKRWRFLGLLEYLRHYQETQVDVNGMLRQVWIFEFVIHQEPLSVLVSHDNEISNELCQSRSPDDLDLSNERQIDQFPTAQDTPAYTSSIQELSTIRAKLLSLAPMDFEHFIKDVLLETGFERVAVTKYSQDGGIDINAYCGNHLWPLKNLLIQVQAKRWLHTVGRREVAELRGSLEPFARGVVVTTSRFSKAATIEADALGRSPITLIDGNQFGAIIQSLGPRFLGRLDIDFRICED